MGQPWWMRRGRSEEYAAVSRLPLSEQNAAERALADRCFVGRETPDQLSEERVERYCRDCTTPYTVPVEHATSGSKWYSLCPACLRWEL